MPTASVRLIPGVDVEKTQTLNEFGISVSSLVRFREGLFQKVGGWQRFYPNAIGGVPRALHAWDDLNQVTHLGVGTTTNLSSITGGAVQAITPQTMTSDFAPNFSSVMNTNVVTIVDPNIANVTTYDSVYFNTPISIGGIILSGLYPIAVITGVTSYKINAATNATSTVNNAGAVPAFTTTSGSAIVTVTITAHGLSVGNTAVFPIATTVGGVTILGTYQVTAVTDANNFTITVSSQATSSVGPSSMNGGNAEIVYYINIGPPPGGSGYGLGGYGSGGYGTGSPTSAQTGTPITSTDWTLDNWGEILLSCPENGGLYFWDPTGGFVNASLISAGPIFNTGMFVSTRIQILVAYGSTPLSGGIGVQQDPMFVKWSDVSNFLQWAINSSTQAGGYRIPIGSVIRGAIPSGLQNLIWTDLGLWAMSYIGAPDVFGFNEVASKCGLVGKHAVADFRGTKYWMGPNNFFTFDSGGVRVLPCTVWDAVFQDLDAVNASKSRIWTNTPFDEIWWFYPSASGGTGENDSYVKVNITQGMAWDYGKLARSATIDQSVLGNPIAASPQGLIYQHETTLDADGQPLAWAVETGYFVIGDGENMAYVNWLWPDMKWGLFNGSQNATVLITLKAVDYPGDSTVRSYGPYSVTQSTQFITPDLRGRMMALRFEGNDLNSFSRCGMVRYRYNPDGKI